MIGVRLTGRDISRERADLAVCFAYEGDREPRGVVDPALRRELAAQMKEEKFRGLATDLLVWNTDARYRARRFAVQGLGSPERPQSEALRGGAARAARAAASYSAGSLALRLPEAGEAGAPEETRAALEGALLGAYRFDRYLTDPVRKRKRLESVELSADGPRAALRKAVERARVTAFAVWMARDLVNEAPSVLTPPALARRAVSEARRAGLTANVLGPDRLKRLGMGALLAVARGSKEPPRVVHLVHRPASKRRGSRTVLVGKGVTFDSGGLNLKPGSGMLDMKADMSGAAAVLAAMTALPQLGCRDEVHGFLGLVENMGGGSAYKPGDILKTRSGKTVEITNTDAEGRLVLCDLLAHAAETLKPDRMMDLATLTGACVVALGPMASGVFSRDEELRDEILDAGRRAGEKLWPLPMYEEYLDILRQGPADLRNSGGRWGGAVRAALFLGEFVPRDLPWLHLDIAGPAFAERNLPETPRGGTGAGVATLIRWLERN